MSKATIELATKIVEKFAEYEQLDDGIQLVRVPIIGHQAQYFKTEKQEVAITGNREEGTTETEEQDVIVDTSEEFAKKQAIADIARKLEKEEIVLSDTWAEDNLKKA